MKMTSTNDSHSSSTTSHVSVGILSQLEMGSISHLHNKTILEIGSGRGGGLSYLTRIGKPDRALGVDFSKTQVDFCNQVHREIENLEFIEGDATRIQALFPRVETESFDYVLNVESSHCYPNVEVSSVINP